MVWASANDFLSGWTIDVLIFYDNDQASSYDKLKPVNN